MTRTGRAMCHGRERAREGHVHDDEDGADDDALDADEEEGDDLDELAEVSDQQEIDDLDDDNSDDGPLAQDDISERRCE